MDVLWGILWVAWFGIFVVLEGIALHSKAEGDTLSENTRWIFVRKYVRWPSLGVWIGFSGWFAHHIWWG